MSNIEDNENIDSKNNYIYIQKIAEKIVNEYREKYKGEKFLPEPSERTCMAYEILNLLSERKQDKARIKELEEDLYSANKIINEYLDGIPKDKVKKKIREAKYNKKVGNTAYEYTEEEVWDIVKDNLEELLEDNNECERKVEDERYKI